MWCFQPLDVRSPRCLCWTLVCTAAKKGHQSGPLLMNIRLQQALGSSLILIQVPLFFFLSGNWCHHGKKKQGEYGSCPLCLTDSVSGAWHSGNQEHMFLIERCQQDPWCLILIAYDPLSSPPPPAPEGLVSTTASRQEASSHCLLSIPGNSLAYPFSPLWQRLLESFVEFRHPSGPWSSCWGVLCLKGYKET